jgi:hypothetical protein
LITRLELGIILDPVTEFFPAKLLGLCPAGFRGGFFNHQVLDRG